MNESKEVTQSKTRDVAQQAGGETTRLAAEIMLPAVDVYEDDKGITLFADLPGVASDRLNLQVDKDTLLIEGEAAIELPKDLQPLYAEVRTTRYRRSFAIGSEFNTEAIEANLKDGVLSVRLPKKEQYQPRKIQVQVG
jgi:HSP20 family molecular chaperone IbpA